MLYHLFWTAYSTRIDTEKFKQFFGVELESMYCFEMMLARLLGFFRKKDGIYRMTPKGAFFFHYYEGFYTLSYIDKMWGLLRKNAFPESMRL